MAIRIVCCIIISSLLFSKKICAMNLFTQAFEYIVKNAKSSDNDNQQQRPMMMQNGGPNNNGINHPFFKPQQQLPFVNSNGMTSNNQGFFSTNPMRTQPISNVPVIKDACISPEGSLIARIVRSPRNQEHVIVRVVPNNSEQIVFSTSKNESIEKIFFVGSNFVVCAIKNNNNFWHLKAINLLNRTYHKFTPINNATKIDIIPSKNGESICAISCYNGQRYATHSINLRTGQMLSIAENNAKPIIDKNLNVRIFYKLSAPSILGTASGFDVFAIPEGGTDINAAQIDHINDINKEIYVSVAGNYCYKLALQDDNTLVLIGYNLVDGSSIDAGSINGVNSLGICRVNLNSDGHPIFITVGTGEQTQNFPLTNDIQAHLQAIEHQFGGLGWKRISYTADNNVWILCAYTQPACRYFIYDTRNGGMSEIPVDSRRANIMIRPTTSQIPQTQTVEVS